jgi:YggT family protein
MIVLYYFVTTLARVLNAAIMIRILLSWFPIDRNNRLIVILYEITEPILGPIRRLIPGLAGFDISPILALVLIQVTERVLLAVLAGLA